MKDLVNSTNPQQMVQGERIKSQSKLSWTTLWAVWQDFLPPKEMVKLAFGSAPAQIPQRCGTHLITCYT